MAGVSQQRYPSDAPALHRRARHQRPCVRNRHVANQGMDVLVPAGKVRSKLFCDAVRVPVVDLSVAALQRADEVDHLFFLNGTATTEIYTLSLHDALPISHIHNAHRRFAPRDPGPAGAALARDDVAVTAIVDGVHLADETVEVVRRAAGPRLCLVSDADRKSTRLNSSH